MDNGAARRILGHLEARSKLYVAVFSVGFIVGFPAAEEIIEWLLDSRGFVPSGVEVIILQPMEVILLQLRIAAQIAFGLTIIALIVDIAWKGSRSVAAMWRQPREAGWPSVDSSPTPWMYT